MNFSYWEQQEYFTEVDVAIVGSGIVGLFAAIELKTCMPKLKILVLERGVLPNGASTKNAGFACFGSISEILDDLESTPENEVFALIEKRWRGLHKLRQTIGDEALHFEDSGGYEVFDDETTFEKCTSKIDYFNKNLETIIGEKVYEPADEKIKKFGFQKVKHLIFNRFEGQINTGRMMKALLRKASSLDIDVLNGIETLSLQPSGKNVYVVLKGGFILKASRVIVATNAFAKELLPELPLVPGRGQVLVTSPIPNLQIQGAFHYDKGYYYFRNIDNRILLGGGRNIDFKTEETTTFGLTEVIQSKLTHLLREMILPNKQYSIDYRWSGIMGFGKEIAPIVKKTYGNIYCAVKLQGMGVAIGSLVGEEVANLVLEDYSA
ncbi:MAG: FAD-binding oxidoreductase [Verrucomicrobia bacterium]|nr:FAD-binding oxidoreductase [Cytophagales bacterium]